MMTIVSKGQSQNLMILAWYLLHFFKQHFWDIACEYGIPNAETFPTVTFFNSLIFGLIVVIFHVLFANIRGKRYYFYLVDIFVRIH